MERPVLASEMLEAVLHGKLLEYWKLHSPNRPMRYPWEEIALMPRDSLEGKHKVIEVIGPSGAGKTTFLNYLNKEFSDNANVIIRPEFQVVRNGLIQNLDRELKMKGLRAMEYGIKHQMMLWDSAKLISHMSGMTELIEQHDRSTLILERGANDVLAMNPFEYPVHYTLRDDTLFDRDWLRNIFECITLAESVDAVILFGSDWKTTKRRRVAAGLKPEGWLVNKKNWPEVINGYDWWLGSFFPIFRERVGTGLLVIDGRNNSEENNAKALEFSRKIIEM